MVARHPVKVTVVGSNPSGGVYMKDIKKECAKHGLTSFVLEGRGYYRCKKCRSAAVSKRRKNVKQILVKEHGNCCKICGYDRCIDALEFHHLEKDKKSFGISQRGVTIAIDKAREEANKCILLCANCHREVESGIIELKAAIV